LLNQPIKTHLPSVAQLIISLIGFVTCIGSALALFLLAKLSSTVQPLAPQADQSIDVIVWVAFLFSLVTIPSLIYSIRRLARLPMPSAQNHSRLIVSSLFFLAIIALVYLVYTNPDVLSNSIVKVLFSFITVAVPLWWFIELGQNKLNKNSPQRFWGLINFQIFAGLPIVLLVEIILFTLALILGGVWLANKHQFAPILMTLQTQIMIDPKDMTAVINQISPLLQDPGVLAMIFFSFAIAIPLVEEFLKPLALWFFIKNDWTEVEGFSAGLVCGASFALVESVTAIVSLPQDSWTMLLIARVGTGILHTLTAGLTGWALVSAWKTGNYKRLAVAYLISMSLHGLWNCFALLSGLGSNLAVFANSSLVTISSYAPWVLCILFVAMLGMLFFMNRKLRRTSSYPPPLLPLTQDSVG